MPRHARLALDGVSVHLIQRGVDRGACFFCDDDRRHYLALLASAAKEHGCALHAYVLMANHVHLLVTPTSGPTLGRMMKQLNERYVQAVNRQYQRSGPLWDGRFRSCLVDSEAYLMACYRYIELNPVRAGIAVHASAYRWSSHRANATGAPDRPLTPHAIYLALGTDVASRARAYRALVEEVLESSEVDAIRTATRGGHALGSPGFQGQISAMLGRRVAPGRRGRPRRIPVA